MNQINGTNPLARYTIVSGGTVRVGDLVVSGATAGQVTAASTSATTPVIGVASKVLDGEVEVAVGVIAVGIGATTGVLIGMASGYVGGWVDSAMMRVSEMIMSFPSLILAMIINTVMGSNLFNMLAVVGLACVISPVESFSPYVLTRDLPLNLALSISLLVFGLNWRRPKKRGVFARWEAVLWLLAFAGYTVLMIAQEKGIP